jgi:hypothetical protein
VGLWSALVQLRKGNKRSPRAGARRHGDDLTLPLFVRALEDRYVLSVSGLVAHSGVVDLVAETARPLPMATNISAAPVIVDVTHQADGLTVALNGRVLASDSASQLASLHMEGGHAILDVDGLISSAPVVLTIRGLPTDTINLNGSLELAGGSLQVTGQMIHLQGSIHAAGGAVQLNAGPQGTLLISGRIDVGNPLAGHAGGSVQLLGGRVGILAGASIDASGDAGGGAVLIGGDMHGGNPTVANSQQTYFAGEAQVTANALRSGNGGKVVVWSDEATQYFGSIEARGGSLSGNGGTVEVSGKAALAFNGDVDLSAPHGAVGSLLLDPTTIKIDGTGANDAGFSGTILAGDTPSSMSISAAKIVSLLSTTDVSMAAQASIDVTTAIDASGATGAHSLALTAPTITLEIGANITTHGGGLTLAGNVVLAGTANVALSTAPSGVTGGNVLITGTIDGSAANTESLALVSGGGTIEVTGAIGSSHTLGALTIQQDNANATGTATFDSTVKAQSLGLFSRTYAVAFLGGGTITNAVTFSNTGGLTLGNDSSDVLLFSGGVSGGSNPVSMAGAIRTAGAAATFSATTLTAATTIDTTNSGSASAGASIHFLSTIDGGKDLSLTAGSTGTIALDGAVGGSARLGTLTLVNSAGVKVSSSIRVGSLQQLAASGTTDFKGTINTNLATGVNLAAAAITFEQAVTTTSNGGVNVTNSGPLIMASMTLDGAFLQAGGGNVSTSGTLTTTGDAITFTNAVTLTGSLTLDTTSGTPAGANIHFLSTIDGGKDLTLAAGSGGTIALDGAIGGGTPLSSLTVSSAAAVSLPATILTGALGITAAGPIQLTGNVTAGGNQTYNGDVTTAANLQLAGGNLTFNARLSPGGDSTATTLTINGNLAFGASAILYDTLNGTTAGTQYDQLVVTGSSSTVTINAAATLTGEAGHTFSAAHGGDTLTIISSPNAATGSFAQLTSVAISGQSFTINYAFGAGNTNVALIRSATTWTWDGAGNNNDWQNPKNWVGGKGTPGAGDTVHFAGSTRLSPTNSNSAGLQLDQIIFDSGAGSFTLSGNSIALIHGIVNQSTNLQTINMAISLSGDQSFAATSGPLSFGSSAAIDGGFILSLTGPFALAFNAAIGGSTPLTTINADTAMTASAAVNATALTTVNQPYAVALDGGGTITNSVTFSNTGGVTLGNSASDNLLVSGGVNTGGNATSLAGSIRTAGNPITIQSATLAAGTTLDATNGGAVATGGDIHLAVTTSAGNDLTLNAGTGGLVDLRAAGLQFGAFAVTNAASVTLAAGLNATSISITAATITAQGLFATTGGAISFNGPVAMTGDLSADTTIGAATGADIHFASTITGAHNLSLNAGTGGTIALDGDVGTIVSPAGSVTLVNSAGTTTAAITAASLDQQNGSGTSHFQGTVLISGAAGVNITGATVTFDQLVQASGGGMTVTNAGVLTLASVDLMGPFSQSGSGAVTIAPGNNILATGGQPISFSGALTLRGNLLLDSTHANLVPAGANIHLASSIGGNGHNLEVNAGNGTATIDGVAGLSTALGVLALDNAAGFVFNGAVNAAALSILPSAATIAFHGGGAIAAAVTFNNTGGLTLDDNAGDVLLFSGGFDTGANAVSAAGAIRTAGVSAKFDGVALTAATTLDTTNNGAVGGGADIQATNLSPGGNDFALDSGAGGKITMSAAGAFGALRILQAGGVTVGSLLQAASLTQSAGSGTTDFQGAVQTSGAAGIQITAANVTSEQPLTTTGGGGVTVNNSGLLTAGTITLSGAWLQQGSGGVALKGTLATAGKTITFHGPLTLSGDVALDSTNSGGSAGGGSIHLFSTVGGANQLSLNAGTGGTIALDGELGTAGSPLGAVTIVDSAGVTAAKITAAGLAQLAGSGTSDFQGPVTTSRAAGVNIIGGGITFEQIVTTTGGGGTTVTNAGLLKMDSMTLSGNFLQQGGGGVQAKGTLATAGKSVTFTSGLTLSGNLSLDTTDAAAVPGGNDIRLLATVDGGSDLAMNAGTTGNVQFGGAVGGIVPVGAVTIVSSNLVTIGSMTLTGAFLQQGGGTISARGTLATAGKSITMAGAVNLAGSLALDTTNGGSSRNGANIHLEAAVDGGQDLVLNAGSGGTIALDGNVGSGVAVGALTLVNAAGVSTAEIHAASLKQTQGGGTSDFKGQVSTSGIAGVDVTGSIVTFEQSISAAGGGVTITNAGQLTIGPVTASGAILQKGGGGVAAHGTMSTAGATITFTNSVAISASIGFATDLGVAAGADIHFLSALTGAGQNIALEAGNSGRVSVDGDVGASAAPLGNVSLANAQAYIFNGAVFADSLTTANTAESIALLGGGALAQAVTFTNTGGLTIGNSAGDVIVFAAGFQTGSNSVALAGTIRTVGASMSISNALLTDATTLDATNNGAAADGANIQFTAVGNGTSLALNAGNKGQIQFSATGGSLFGDVTLQNSASATVGALQARSFTQTNSTGTTEFLGTLQTSAASGVNVTGVNVTFDQPVATTGGGGVTVTNSGLLTLGPMSVDGAFLQQGGGSSNLQGALTTTGHAITFSGPMNLIGDLALDTTNGGGSPAGANIRLLSTVAGPQNLSLNAGSTGTIGLSAGLGSSGAAMGGVTIVNSAGVAASAITAASLTQLAGSGTSDFQGPISTLGAAGVNIAGSGVAFEQLVTTAGGGGVTVTNSGLLNMNSMALSGDFLQQGGNAQAKGTVATAGKSITFTGGLTLSGNLSLDTTGSASAPSGGDVRLLSAVDGGGDLLLNGGTAGRITFGGAVGSTTPLGAVTIISSNLLTMGSMQLNGALLQQGGGTVSAQGTLATAGKSVTLSGAVTLSGPMSIDTTRGGIASTGGSIHFLSAIDGGQDFSLNAGSGGAIALDGALGAVAPLGAVGITSSAGVVTGAISASSLKQQGGTGTTDFQGPILTSGPLGIDIAGANVMFQQLVTTSGNGGVTVTNSGLLTLNSMSLSGGFLQQGGGGTAAQGTLATSGKPITFTNSLALAGGLVLDTTNAGAAAGDSIALGAAVDGGFSLQINAGTNRVDFFGSIGGTAALDQINIVRADAGLAFGSDLRSVASITTLRAIQLGSAAPIAGGIVFDGGANPAELLSVRMIGAGSPGSVMMVNGPVTIDSNVLIDTGKASANGVLFTPAAPVDSLAGRPRSLTIVAGTGGVEFQDKVGFINPLNQITVDTSGQVAIDNGDALRTVKPGPVFSAVSNLPPPLRIQPPDPAAPLIVSNRTQTIVGVFGGDPANFPLDHIELGENIQINVVWADKIVSTLPPGVVVNAGDTVTLVVNEDGSSQQWTIVHGGGSGPVHFKLQHTYAFGFLATVGPDVNAKVTVSYDPSIVLRDARVTNTQGLTSSQGTVQTPVAGNQFDTTQTPISSIKPIDIESVGPVLIPPATPTNTLPEAKAAESSHPQGEQTDRGQRQLTLVRVGPNEEDGEPHALPDDALERLNDLFEKFKRMLLPNGRYRIYLEEPGFPKRQLREFYKSRDVIGDPVREPGPGSRELNVAPQGGASNPAEPGNEKPTVQPSSTRPVQPPASATSLPDNSPADDSATAAAAMWRTMGRLKYPLAAATILAVNGSRETAKRTRHDTVERPSRPLGLLARLRRTAMGRKD